MLKLFILLTLLFNLNPFTNKINLLQNKPIKSCAMSYSNTVYLNNIFVYGNHSIEFYIPSNLRFSYLHPFSLVSPSGKQLIHIVPQSINITNSNVSIRLNRTLEEHGTYQITFTGVDKNSNEQVDLIGQFQYR